MFDNLPFLNGPTSSADTDKLKHYLAADVVPGIKDPISWWQGKRTKYPCLSRMAIDYLNIPGMCSPCASVIDETDCCGPPQATSVGVEHIFSRGRLLLLHVRNQMTAENMRASMCLGVWAQHGLVNTTDMFHTVQLPEVEEDAQAVAGP